MPLIAEQSVEIMFLSGRDGATGRSVAEHLDKKHFHKDVSHTSVGRLSKKSKIPEKLVTFLTRSKLGLQIYLGRHFHKCWRK